MDFEVRAARAEDLDQLDDLLGIAFSHDQNAEGRDLFRATLEVDRTRCEYGAQAEQNRNWEQSMHWNTFVKWLNGTLQDGREL